MGNHLGSELTAQVAAQSLGLSEKTLLSMMEIFSKQVGIRRVVVYGSRATGRYKEGSDIDLILDAPNLLFSELSALKVAFGDSMIPQEVDLALLHEVTNSELLSHIERVGIVVFEARALE